MNAHHRAIVALNNTGVELLQRNCLQQAMDTFRDAIFMMKDAMDRPNVGHRDTPATKTSQLKAAAQRLASPRPSTASFTNGMVIKVISDDEKLSTVLAGSQLFSSHGELLVPTATCHPSCENVKYLVRIEPVNMLRTTKEEHSLHSAMILYNFGMAYHCLESLDTSAPYLNALREGSKHFFFLTHSLLSSRDMPDTTDYHEALNNDPIFDRVMLVTVMALHRLLELSSLDADDKDRQCYAYFLGRLSVLLPALHALVAIEENSMLQAARVA